MNIDYRSQNILLYGANPIFIKEEQA
jgi:hypothetical protein